MGRPTKLGQKVRLNLEMPASTKAMIEKARDDGNFESMSETVRRALEVYTVVMDAQAAGTELFFEKPNGKREKIILL